MFISEKYLEKSKKFIVPAAILGTAAAGFAIRRKNLQKKIDALQKEIDSEKDPHKKKLMINERRKLKIMKTNSSLTQTGKTAINAEKAAFKKILGVRKKEEEK